MNLGTLFQIIESFPHSLVLYNTQAPRLEHLNLRAKKHFEQYKGSQLPLKSIITKITREDEQANLAGYWQICQHLRGNEAHSTSFWLNLSGDGFACYKINTVALAVNSSSVDYLLISVIREDDKDLKDMQEEFINLASHDLLSPVRKASTFAGRLKETFPETPEENIYLARLENSLEAMRSLILSLTEYSLNSLTPLTLEWINLNDIIDQVIQTTQPLIEKHGIEISRGDLPGTYADKNQCLILFGQLIDNAVRFRKEDVCGRIHIYAKEVGNPGTSLPPDDGNKTWQIIVSDNGIGFPDAESENIFKPFVRLHGKSGNGGNGLGLALCRKIAASFGWNLYGECADGTQTCFTLILPQARNSNV